ncbi:immunity 26/phosphotriesterase HocA family protein [Pedobacter sp. PWIIR3]
MRQKETIGAFFKVPLNEGFHTYGRIIRNCVYAFYDHKTHKDILDLTDIESAPVLFKVYVMSSVIKKGRWPIIGISELPKNLDVVEPFFIQDIGDPKICWIDYHGERTKVSPEECIGLEQLAVWDYMHVENRLIDFYNGITYKSRLEL